MMKPQSAALQFELVPGALAIAPGLLFLESSRALLAADVHFAYEDVIGGALPLWSTAKNAGVLAAAAQTLDAREIILLGDVIHGAIMSEGAATEVAAALRALRDSVKLTLIAGNHEGRSRGRTVLGETVEWLERDGWLLLHGDVAPPLGSRCIIGHLHPSLHLGGGASVPAFLAGRDLIVMPALTPYSPGLDVCSDATLLALAPYNITRKDVHVVAAGAERVFPFGRLSALREAVRPRTGPPKRFRRKFLRGDGTK